MPVLYLWLQQPYPHFLHTYNTVTTHRKATKISYQLSTKYSRDRFLPEKGRVYINSLEMLLFLFYTKLWY